MKTNHLFIASSNKIYQLLFLSIALFISSFILVETAHAGSSQSISVPISNGNDDVEEMEKKGAIIFDSPDLELIYDKNDKKADDYDKENKQKKQIVGLRFNGIGIPQGASISRAYIEFTADEADSKSTSLLITGHAVDNASSFESSEYNVSSRSRTSASINWSPEAWATVGSKEHTPELRSIVQEIVNRPGWTASNSMAFIIEGKKKEKRVAESFEGSANDAPKLVIVYGAAESALPFIELNAPVIVDEPKNPGTFQLISDTQDTGVLDMGIEFRGSTSQEFEKKSFGIEIVKQDDPSDEMNVRLLDLRNDGDWILDASYRDTSFVRNIIGHDIFNAMRPYAYIDENGEEKGQATIRGYLTEVYLNGLYHGVYVLEERVDRKLLDLKKINVPEDANGNELFDQIDFSDPENGSVLYKADNNFATLGNLNSARVDFEQDYPDIDDVARWEPLEDLIRFITTSSDSEFISRISSIVELDSVVDYWLLMHVIADVDSFKKNYFLARSGSGKFFFAPWDNDASFNMSWTGARLDESVSYLELNENILFKRLIGLPQTGFNTLIKQRWDILRGNLFTQEALTSRFEGYHSLLDAKGQNGESARDRNLARWPGSGNEGANNPELGTAQFISGWIGDRLEFLDVQIANLPE